MFKSRSQEKELLDRSDIKRDELFRNLEELDIINKHLGGHKMSVNSIKFLLNKGSKLHPLAIVDIGCGGGDSMRAMANWSAKNNYNVHLSGIDLKQDCIDFCRINDKNGSKINYIKDDYRNILNHLEKVDIIHAALFCHHLTNEQILELIKFCSHNNIILLINELERNPIAYYSIKLLTKLFSRSYLVKNDAPLSVLRGFKKREWVELIKLAGVINYSVKNKWAFRHQIIIYPYGR